MHRMILLVISILLGGCQSLMINHYDRAPVSVSQALVADTLAPLRLDYPPAHTQFVMVNSQDVYGRLLIQRLRQQGYGVLEVSGQSRPLQKTAVIQLGYVVEGIENSNAYRLTLTLNQTVLSRAYALTQTQLRPIGPWSKGVCR